ncbi:MAG: MBL fold metallo-hydrolase [Ignavibacteriae bacterium]|nr:MBL fold metallo-hydrolase [Ignavibacteriota bacterium]
MEIKQFYDECLAHASYAILSEGEVALVDPARDPKPYYDFAKDNNSKITAVIETHPHADFVSSHLEISKHTGAKVYTSDLYGPKYDYTAFDDGDELKLGNITLQSINTPGHSPDSISILIKDEDGKDYALATGDTLFVGDVGRPDLRESAGAISKKREELARMMYNTIHEKLLNISDDVLVYPAHGAGSLCGKALSSDRYSTMGREKKTNYALQPMGEDEFIDVLLEGQPFIPKYFGYDVETNRQGAPDFEESVVNVPRIKTKDIKPGILIIDARMADEYRNGHLEGAINIAPGRAFETWLGSIVAPDEKYYLVASDDESVEKMIRRTAKIGYESKIEGALVNTGTVISNGDTIDYGDLKQNPQNYTIIDVRNPGELADFTIFDSAVNIPLAELRDRVSEIDTSKPVVVHCAGGSRGSTGASIISEKTGKQAFDLGNKIRLFI